VQAAGDIRLWNAGALRVESERASLTRTALLRMFATFCGKRGRAVSENDLQEQQVMIDAFPGDGSVITRLQAIAIV